METELLVKTARVTKTPSDGKGTFDFAILAFGVVDADNEIIENFENVRAGDRAKVDVDYGHMAVLGDGADPVAGKIGEAEVIQIENLLHGLAQLDLSNRVALMVYERIQLPSDDPAFLGEVSVWFAFDPAKTSVDDETGVRTIRDAKLLSVAVVKEGAQKTIIENVKRAWKAAAGRGEPITRGEWETLDEILGGTLAEQKAALIREFGDDARDVFDGSELSDAAKSLLAQIDRGAAVEFDEMIRNYRGGPMPEINSRFAEIRKPAPIPAGPPETFRMPVVTTEPDSYRIEE